MNNLSIIIPSRNEKNLTACVAALRAMDERARVIVLDDGLPRGWFGRAGDITIRGAQPFIYARNCNAGILAAGNDDVILLNDDALLKTPCGFEAMQGAAHEHGYGLVGAVTNVTGQPLQHAQNIGLRQVPHFAFVCALILRKTIERIGLLDERYCLDYGVEDLDYCEACNRAGVKVGVFDFCFVDHSCLTSTFRGAPNAHGSFTRNKALFDAKWAKAS